MDRGISEEIKADGGAATGSGEVEWLDGVEGCQEVKDAIAESIPMEWTDEKHNSYLNSMEASFVNQLYNHEFNSNHLLGWSSRPQKNPHLSGPHTGNCYSGQFKVLRGGFWSEVKFERSRTLADAQNETLVLSRNPWIQHFRSNSDNEGVGSGAHTEINCTSEQEIDIGRKRQGEESCGEAASSSQLPSCCTHTCHEDSLRSSTEATGQNFVDDLEGDNRVSRLCKKRRPICQETTRIPHPIKGMIRIALAQRPQRSIEKPLTVVFLRSKFKRGKKSFRYHFQIFGARASMITDLL